MGNIIIGVDCGERADVRHSGHLQRPAGVPRLLAAFLHSRCSAIRWEILQVRRRQRRALRSQCKRHTVSLSIHANLTWELD